MVDTSIKKVYYIQCERAFKANLILTLKAIGQKEYKMHTVDETYTRTFCGKSINIKEYQSQFAETVNDRQKNAKFIRYSWLDISSYTLDDPRLDNIAVRADQNTGVSTDDIAHSFEIEGWDTSYFPPIVGADNVPRDGRTRIRAAIKCGQKFIPCAIYAYDKNDSVRSNYSNGLIANKHKTQVRAQWQDFIASGVAIIKSGEMTCEMGDILDWLYNEVEIEHFYSNTGGNITKLAKQIYERAARGGDLIVLRKREEWIDWIGNSIAKYSLYYHDKFGIKDIKDIQVYESGGSRADHVFCKHILPNASSGKITNLLLYTTADDADKAKMNHVEFERQLEAFHSQIYGWINTELDGITLKKPKKTKLWRIIGVVPQLLTDDHKKLLARNYLASLDDFRVKSSLSRALGIEEYMYEDA